MSRKLTEEERANLYAIQRALGNALPLDQRGMAGYIASALVRVQGDTITQRHLNKILGDLGEARNAVESVVKKVALKSVAGQANTYVLMSLGEGEEADQREGHAHKAPGEAQEQAGQARPRERSQEKPPAKKRLPSPQQARTKRLPASEGGAKGLLGQAAQEADAPQDAIDESIATTQAEAEGGKTPRPNPKVEAASQEPDATDPRAEASPGGSQPEDIPPEDPRPAAEAEAQDETPKEGATREEVDLPDQLVPGREAPDQEAPGPEATNQPEPAPEPKPEPTPQPKPPEPKRRSPTALRYIRRDGPLSHEVRARILELDQRFWINGWLLSHPDAYSLYKHEILALNDLVTQGVATGDVTRRQLAYQIDGDEKFFEMGASGQKLLHAMGMEDVVRRRPMPKYDLVYFAPRQRKCMRVVITENLDPWYDIHDIMYEEGRVTILGEHVHAVILGEGTAILDANHPNLQHNRLARLLNSLGAETIELLYWGDIDRAGIDIMNRLNEVIGDRYPLRPFTAAYRLMIGRARDRYPEPLDNERTSQVNEEVPDLSLFAQGLDQEDLAYATSVIDHSRLIPQEILTRTDL